MRNSQGWSIDIFLLLRTEAMLNLKRLLNEQMCCIEARWAVPHMRIRASPEGLLAGGIGRFAPLAPIWS